MAPESEGSIEVHSGLFIPAAELRFTASRSGGPGGQHVNKVSSRVTLHFDVAGSAVLDPAQKRRIADRLPTRINREGVLQIHVRKHRSQAANRVLAVERFAELIREALRPRRPRRRTRVPGAELRRRLQAKRRRAALKQDRGRVRQDRES